MRPLCILLFCVCASVISQARGEDQQVTDIELRAAYCLGVSTAQFEDATKETQLKRQQVARGNNKAIDYMSLRVSEDIQKIIAERRDRLRDYLKIKGFLNGRSVKEIDIPLERGVKDARQCSVDAKDTTQQQCRKTCGPLNTVADYKRCDSKCSDSDSCARVKRCLENFLPF